LGLDDSYQTGADEVGVYEGAYGDEKKRAGKEGLELYERERTMGESKLPRVKNGARCPRLFC